MSWNPGVIQDLLTRSRYLTGTGRVGLEAERGVIEAVKQNQPAIDQGNPAISSISNANGTAQTLRASAGRLYWIVVVNTDDDAVNVVLGDGGDTIIVGGCTCPAQIAASGSIPAIPGVAKVAFFASPNAAGQAILTDLRARAFKSSDGTTGADNGVTVYAVTSA